MITDRSLSIHSLSKHRNVRLSSSRGQPALASPLIRTNRLDEKTSEHCRETKWRERERERRREKGVGCGFVAKELLRLCSFSNAVVIYSYGSFGVAHAHGDPLGLSACREEAVDGKKREKERKEEQESSEETPTGQPTRSKGRDTLGSRV